MELGDGWRRVPEQSLHVTLAFLGHLEEAEPVIAAVAGAVRPITRLSISEAVLLPPRRPRVIAVKLAGDMAALQSSVSGSLADAGLYVPEKRPFLPHVTIGRARDRVSRSVPATPALSFMAPSVSVFRSRLSPKGASYEPLATFPVPTIATDAVVLRAVRLAALRDAPGSFTRSFEEEAAKPDSWWQSLAARSAAGVTDRVFLVPAPPGAPAAASPGATPAGAAAPVPAEPAGVAPPAGAPDAAGMAAGHREGEDVVLWGMWVAPAARGGGLGRALLAAVLDWARSAGAARVVLAVRDGVAGAAALYASAGFAPSHREGDQTHYALRLQPGTRIPRRW